MSGLTSALVATVHGNGPFVPVIVWREGRYPVGPAMAEMQDALHVAMAHAEAIRDAVRGEGWRP